MPQNPSVIATKTPTSEVRILLHLRQLFPPNSFLFLRCLFSTPASRERPSKTLMASASLSSVWGGIKRKGETLQHNLEHSRMIFGKFSLLGNNDIQYSSTLSGTACPGTQTWMGICSLPAMTKPSVSGTSMGLLRRIRYQSMFCYFFFENRIARSGVKFGNILMNILYLNPPTNQINLPQLIRSHNKPLNPPTIR